MPFGEDGRRGVAFGGRIEQREAGCARPRHAREPRLQRPQFGQHIDDRRALRNGRPLQIVPRGEQLRTQIGFDGSVDFHYVAPQVWAEQRTNLDQQQIEQQRFELSDYTLLNGRLGYRFLQNAAEVSAVGFNLVDVKHRQHPFGQLVGRRVMAMFTYRF